jgi:predicted patatin/cPLA2 family phospholipase
LKWPSFGFKQENAAMNDKSANSNYLLKKVFTQCLRRVGAPVFSMSLIIFLFGCSSTSRIAQVPPGQDFRCETQSDYLFNRLDVMSQLTRDQSSLDFLLLSGGGARGAWGAGFLKGWQSRQTNGDDATGIPDFDLVTGVSTGALQATHAFLGDYDKLYEIYTTIENDEVWRKRFWLTAPFSNSLLKSNPLGKYIEELVTDELLRRVHANSPGRMLCVGTVNLSTGQFREWDLTAIASAFVAADGNADDQAGLLNLYQTVLLGSAAIPLAFPPVEIADERGPALYVDGGTRENVFVSFGDLLDLAIAPIGGLRSFDGRKGDSIIDNMTVRIFVVVNGQLGIAPASVNNSLLPIAGRSFETVMAQLSNGALYQVAYELAQRNSTAIGIDTRYTYIPSDKCLSNTALDFDPAAMTELANDAAKLGAGFKWFDFDPNSSLESCDASLLSY